jgi:5-methylcytosine-specific restriction endonuclease McrA
MRTFLLHDFLRDDAGTPLGPGMPSGRPLRLDGERHYDAWLRLLRADPCAYCGRAGGTVDHVEPRSRPARGLGSVHGWGNVVGACGRCNGAKRDRPLLAFLLSRPRTLRRPAPHAGAHVDGDGRPAGR